MGISNETIFATILKGQWEKTKGELQAIRKMVGSVYSGDHNQNLTTENYMIFSQLVDSFIETVEDEGLVEPS